MTPRGRLLATLDRCPVDRPPFVCPGGMMNMAVVELMELTGCFWPEAHTDPVKMAGLTFGARDHAGVENLGVPFCMTVEAEGLGAPVGLGDRYHEPRVLSYPVKEMEGFAALPPLDVEKGRARTMIEAVSILRREGGDTPVIANLTGPVSLVTSLIDPNLFYRAMVRDAEGAHRALRIVTENLIRFGDALIDAGADIVCIADPSATGEIVGRTIFSRFAIHYLNVLTNHFRTFKGTPSIVHICGDLNVVGDLLDGVESTAISVDAMVSIDAIKGHVPKKALMGNVSTYKLEKGSPDGLARQGRRLLERGVDILAPACGVSPRTTVLNIRSVADTAKGFAPGDHGAH